MRRRPGARSGAGEPRIAFGVVKKNDLIAWHEVERIANSLRDGDLAFDGEAGFDGDSLVLPKELL